MQTCIVPVLSFNYAAGNPPLCRRTLRDAILFGMALMVVGTVCFVTIPGPMLRVFSQNIRVIEIGRVGFHFVGMNFLLLVTSLTFPAVGSIALPRSSRLSAWWWWLSRTVSTGGTWAGSTAGPASLVEAVPQPNE